MRLKTNKNTIKQTAEQQKLLNNYQTNKNKKKNILKTARTIKTTST